MPTKYTKFFKVFFIKKIRYLFFFKKKNKNYLVFESVLFLKQNDGFLIGKLSIKKIKNNVSLQKGPNFFKFFSQEN